MIHQDNEKRKAIDNFSEPLYEARFFAHPSLRWGSDISNQGLLAVRAFSQLGRVHQKACAFFHVWYHRALLITPFEVIKARVCIIIFNQFFRVPRVNDAQQAAFSPNV